jgi:hypothetical protein
MHRVAVLATLAVIATGCSSDAVPTEDPLRCEPNRDQIVQLLQSGQFPFDFEPATDLDDLVQNSDLILTGTIESFVRETSTEGEERTVLRSSDSRVLKSATADQPAVPMFSFATAWGNRAGPDPIAQPVVVADVSFVAFLYRSTDDPNTFVVGAQSLQIACTDSTGPTVSITASPPADASELALDELVAAVN